jgi:hypothetical protein
MNNITDPNRRKAKPKLGEIAEAILFCERIIFNQRPHFRIEIDKRKHDVCGDKNGAHERKPVDIRKWEKKAHGGEPDQNNFFSLLLVSVRNATGEGNRNQRTEIRPLQPRWHQVRW